MIGISIRDRIINEEICRRTKVPDIAQWIINGRHPTRWPEDLVKQLMDARRARAATLDMFGEAYVQQ